MQRPARRWRLRDAFGFFKAVAANPRWAWSARSANGKTVVLTWWKDEIAREGGNLIHNTYGHPRLKRMRELLGHYDRIRNLIWAREHCGGLYRVVWCKVKDRKARVRKIVECYPDETLWMRLTQLNETTGEFRSVEERRGEMDRKAKSAPKRPQGGLR